MLVLPLNSFSMANLNNTTEMTEIQKNWDKTERYVKQIGLRDGITNGKEANFQENFDKGFLEGFCSGYAIGQYKGAIFLQKPASIPASAAELLKQPKVAWCQTCQSKEAPNQSISEVSAYQTAVSNKNLEHLNSVYFQNYDSDLLLPSRLN
jgi:flagellar biosynthesis/type III secretory pathway protein FliH